MDKCRKKSVLCGVRVRWFRATRPCPKLGRMKFLVINIKRIFVNTIFDEIFPMIKDKTPKIWLVISSWQCGTLIWCKKRWNHGNEFYEIGSTCIFDHGPPIALHVNHCNIMTLTLDWCNLFDLVYTFCCQTNRNIYI